MGATPRDESGWTIETYSAYNEALRLAQDKLDEERDRRYREVQAARDVTRQVRYTAADIALDRIRVEQEALEQRFDAALSAFQARYEAAHKPLADYVAAQLGRSEAVSQSTRIIYSVLTLAVAIIVASILFSEHIHPKPAGTVTITTETRK